MTQNKNLRPSPNPFANPLNLSKKSSEKELHNPGNDISRTGTPNNEKGPRLLPSPVIRSVSRASVKSQHEPSGVGGDKNDDEEKDEEAPRTHKESDEDELIV